MAHFAKLDKNNVVEQVIVIDNDKTHDEDGVEREEIGIDFCKELFGANTNWVQTSYNASFRKKFAAIGDTYNSELDAFIPPKDSDLPSWVLDPNTCEWVAPKPKPAEKEGFATLWIEAAGKWEQYPTVWNEETKSYETIIPKELQ